MAEAAQSGDAVHEAIRDTGCGHKMFNRIDGADGDFGFDRAKRVHLLPEADGIPQLAFRDETQPLMLLPQHEGAPLVAQAFAITVEQRVANVFALEWKASGLDGKMSADGKPHQIDGVDHGPGFVEVIHSPDETAFDVAPSAEIFHMKIADGENVRGLGEIRTDLRPELRPAVAGGAKERKEFRLHASVLETKVFLVEMSALGQPFFEIAGGFDDVHAGNDSDGEKEKSN